MILVSSIFSSCLNPYGCASLFLSVLFRVLATWPGPIQRIKSFDVFIASMHLSNAGKLVEGAILMGVSRFIDSPKTWLGPFGQDLVLALNRLSLLFLIVSLGICPELVLLFSALLGLLCFVGSFFVFLRWRSRVLIGLACVFTFWTFFFYLVYCTPLFGLDCLFRGFPRLTRVCLPFSFFLDLGASLT